MVSVTDPLNRVRSFAYDADGNQTSVTDAKGQVTGYDYDAMNRVTTITRPDNQTISYTYDKNGTRTMMSDPTGYVNYTFVAQLAESVGKVPGGARTVERPAPRMAAGP